jgi:hypothetical protein
MRGIPSIRLALLALLLAGPAAADPYDTLKLYDGTWKVRTDGGAVVKLQNRCTANGMFFICEQVIGGNTSALVVFLPTGPGENGEQTYRTQALGSPTDSRSGWNHLSITGSRWIFAPEDVPADAHDQERTVSIFLDADHIHFEVQHSTDGGPWTRKTSGDEERVR